MNAEIGKTPQYYAMYINIIYSTLISHTYEESGLKKAQDIAGNLEKHQMKKDSVQNGEKWISVTNVLTDV